ncbi:unnamed protein product [Boreogadus saida]
MIRVALRGLPATLDRLSLHTHRFMSNSTMGHLHTDPKKGTSSSAPDRTVLSLVFGSVPWDTSTQTQRKAPHTSLLLAFFPAD